jgi:hypothetical protein
VPGHRPSVRSVPRGAGCRREGRPRGRRGSGRSARAAAAAALQTRGHDVTLCSASRLREQVQAHALPFLPAGLDWHVSDPGYIDVLCQAAGGLAFTKLTGEQRFASVTANLFIGAAARCMLLDLVGLWGSP